MGLCLLKKKKKKKEDDIYQAILERRHYVGGTPVSEFSLVLFLPSVLSTWREIYRIERHARCSQEWRMCVNSSLSSSDVHITDSGAFSAELQEVSKSFSVPPPVNWNWHPGPMPSAIPGAILSLHQPPPWSLSYPCLYLMNSLLLYF